MQGGCPLQGVCARTGVGARHGEPVGDHPDIGGAGEAWPRPYVRVRKGRPPRKPVRHRVGVPSCLPGEAWPRGGGRRRRMWATLGVRAAENTGEEILRS